MPNNWKETTLGEVLEITSSKRIFAKEYLQQGMPFYRGKEIIEKYNGNEVSTELFISHKKYNEIKEKFGVPQEGDMLLTSVGTLGIPYLVKEREEFYFKDGNLTWFKNFNGIENTYLYYWIISDLGKDQLAKQTIGSTQQALTIIGLKNISILLPPLPEQKAIAAVLSSFDDKIELLRRQNKTLENIAQTIFKEWFVKFYFPNKNGKPYSISGGKMKSSELGEIPERWRVTLLSEFVETINGYSYKGDELTETGQEALVTLKSFDRNGGFQVRGFKPFVGNPKAEQEVVVGDLVVAHTDLTQDAAVLGNPALIYNNGGYKKMYITMDLVKVMPKKKQVSIGFLYFLMKTNRFKMHCVGYANGTTVLHLSKKAIPEFELPIPENLDYIEKYSMIADKTIHKISVNNDQIQTLSKLRDTLLPKLMKGEIRVK